MRTHEALNLMTMLSQETGCSARFCRPCTGKASFKKQPCRIVSMAWMLK